MAYDEAEVGAIVTPHLVAAGLDLEQIKISNAGPKSVIAVVVDNDAGPTLDQLAKVSSTLSDAVDGADDVFGGQAFTLEVTTPGAERPLTAPRHWRRSRGRRAHLELHDGTAIVARIGALSATADQVTVVIAGERRAAAPTTRELALADIRSAVVQVEFKKPDPRELDLSGHAVGRVLAGTEPADLTEEHK